MRKCLVTAYIGLMGPGGQEPPAETGYCRVGIGEVDLWEAPRLLTGRQIVFNEIKAPGYGRIYSIGMYNAPEGGELLYVWDVPENMDFHAGVIPAILDGRLVRGLEVSMEILMSTQIAMSI